MKCWSTSQSLIIVTLLLAELLLPLLRNTMTSIKQMMDNENEEGRKASAMGAIPPAKNRKHKGKASIGRQACRQELKTLQPISLHKVRLELLQSRQLVY